jgi:DNA replication and repair protein RecF
VTYQHLLAQRNTLLKNIRDHGAARSQLSLWDDQLVRSAAHITVKRLEAVKKLALLAGARHQVISDGREALSIRYELHGQTEKMMTNELPSWYNKRLAERQELDIMRGVTSVGPHRDDLCFMVDGVDLKAYGSQGQQRTGVLSLKLAELEFLRSETGEYPVLLLDDVMSELDADRRAKLLQFIRDEGIQTLITATDEAYFPAERIGAYYQVTAGKVRRLA